MTQNWTILSGDSKRVFVRCVCGTTRVMSRDVVVSGESLGCGCRQTWFQRWPDKDHRRPAEIAAAEAYTARKRQFGRT